jgi:hypothetical protein
VECRLTGEYRWREVRGFGPFKKEVWDAEPFTCVLRSDSGRVSPTDGLRFGLARTPNGFVVEGSIEGVECYFDEFRFGEGRTTGGFTMITIANIEVRGQLEILGGTLALSMARGFAA